MISKIKFSDFFYLPVSGVLLSCSKYGDDEENLYFNVYKRVKNKENEML